MKIDSFVNSFNLLMLFDILLEEIINYVNDFNDVLSLASVDHAIRDTLMLSNVLMRRTLVKFKDTDDLEAAFRFINQFGSKFHNVSIETRQHFEPILNAVLNNAYNLKDLSIKFYDDGKNNAELLKKNFSEKLIDLHSLQKLEINDSSVLEYLISITKNISLQVLAVDFIEMKNPEIFRKFLTSQNNLQELYITTENVLAKDIFLFVIPIKLKIMKLDIKTEDHKKILKFLLLQADFLIELTLNNIPCFERYKNVLRKFMRLRSLTIGKDTMCSNSNETFDTHKFTEHQLENLIFLDDRREATNVIEINQISKYIETLKCNELKIHDPHSLENLKELQINHLRCQSIIGLRVENVESVVIKSMKYFDGATFDSIFSNVKHLTICSLVRSEDVLTIIQHLENFHNLETFKLRKGPAAANMMNIDDDEVVKRNSVFFKILIDTKDKRIKVSSYIYTKCSPIIQNLERIFRSYQIIQFCFEEPPISIDDVDATNLNFKTDEYAKFNDFVEMIPAFHCFEKDGARTGSYFDHDDFPYQIKKIETSLMTFHWYVGIKTVWSQFLSLHKGNMRELTIHKLPSNQDYPLKYIFEHMKLDAFYYGDVPLILNGNKQDVDELSITNLQFQSANEMFRQFSTITKLTIILTETDVDSYEIEKILNRDTELFKPVQKLELIDRSCSRRHLGLYLRFLKNFPNIFSLKLESNDGNMNSILQELLPQMIKLKRIYINSTAPNPVERLLLIKRTIINLKKLWVAATFIELAKSIFSDDVEIMQTD